MRGGLGGFWHWDHHGFMGFSWLRLNRRNTQQPFGFAAHPTPAPGTARCHPRGDAAGARDFHPTVKMREEEKKQKGAPQHRGFTT